MSATERLRELLDERGIEYFKHEDGEPLRKLEKADKPATSWHIGGAGWCAVPREGSDLFDLWIDKCTPEQAVATLGRGECEIETTENWLPAERYHRCKHCGAFFAVMNASGDIQPCVCPNCGRAVKR